MKITKKTILFIILIVFFVVADRFLKVLCLNGYFDRPVPVLGDIFSLDFVKNYYISFSIPFSGPILTIFIGLIILILLFYWFKLYVANIGNKTVDINLSPLTLLIIGAILNFTDRISYGFVVDYFSLKYFTVFNLADVMICAGVLWLIFSKKDIKF
jgi:signal peptidase II